MTTVQNANVKAKSNVTVPQAVKSNPSVKADNTKVSVKATDRARQRNSNAAKKDQNVKVDESKLIKAVDMELTTGRNFYAVKTTAKGKEIHYAFETVNERNHWLTRHLDSKPTDARSVYRVLKRAHNEVVATNRNHRVVKLNYDELVDPTKGTRALIK